MRAPAAIAWKKKKHFSSASKTLSSLTKPRIFIAGAHQPGEAVAITGGDARKLQTVLRLQSGDAIEIIDSAANRFAATLEVEGSSVRAVLGAAAESEAQACCEITLAQGIPKAQKMDFVVEKLTELGVAQIIPLRSERTIADAGPGKIERWRRLAKTAAQQSGRTTVPQIAQPQNFAELIASFPAYDRILLPWESAEPALLRDRLPRLLEGTRRVLIVIGPEGGFSGSEADAAADAGAELLSLGRRILRTETAAMVVMSIINYLI